MKLEKVVNNMEEAKDNMDGANKEIKTTIERNETKNTTLIFAVIGVFLFVCFLIWITFY